MNQPRRAAGTAYPNRLYGGSKCPDMRAATDSVHSKKGTHTIRKGLFKQ